MIRLLENSYAFQAGVDSCSCVTELVPPEAGLLYRIPFLSVLVLTCLPALPPARDDVLGLAMENTLRCLPLDMWLNSIVLIV